MDCSVPSMMEAQAGKSSTNGSRTTKLGLNTEFLAVAPDIAKAGSP